MQLPIPVGTILQNRYRLLSILGQGGFGRTYLAEDLGRFQERCAIKELIPDPHTTELMEKVKELFQREASTLYQIQHPQIPQFRATFEQDGRLFLIQEYVEGNTYYQILQERKANGLAFSEAEILQFLRQILPVLVYLHGRGIIHRDISPDNIIFQGNTQLPVIIDFGVVKELAHKLQSSIMGTTVGKLGYAPGEQIQSGRAYPNSDLYALAVTCIVLLTGKEPQELFDDKNLAWDWEKLVHINANLALILNKMLSFKPGDRYQSAMEILEILQPDLSPEQTQEPTLVVQQQKISPDHTSVHIPDQDENKSIWEQPIIMIGIGLCLAIFTGISTWLLVTQLMISQQNQDDPTSPPPKIFENPTLPSGSKKPPSESDPNAESAPVIDNKELQLLLGEQVLQEGEIKNNATINYIFPGEIGQNLKVTLSGEGVLMTILDADQNPVKNGQRVLQWKGRLRTTGNYTIELRPLQGLTEGKYKLKITLDSADISPPKTKIRPNIKPTNSPNPEPTNSENPNINPTESPNPTIIPIPTPTDKPIDSNPNPENSPNSDPEIKSNPNQNNTETPTPTPTPAENTETPEIPKN